MTLPQKARGGRVESCSPGVMQAVRNLFVLVGEKHSGGTAAKWLGGTATKWSGGAAAMNHEWAAMPL